MLLIYCLIGVFIQGLVVEETTAADIPVLHVNEVYTSNYNFSVKWTPIKIKNDSDPIIGIKVLVWKMRCETYNVYEYDENDRYVKIVKSRSQRYSSDVIPPWKPDYVVVVKPDELIAIVPHIEKEVWYHIRALAFTKTAEGPYSNKTSFKINSTDEKDKESYIDPCNWKQSRRDHDPCNWRGKWGRYFPTPSDNIGRSYTKINTATITYREFGQ